MAQHGVVGSTQVCLAGLPPGSGPCTGCHASHGNAPAWSLQSLAQQLHEAVLSQVVNVGLGAGLHQEEPVEKEHRKRLSSVLSAPKVPILIWQSCDVELWAEVGKGPPAHCVPTTLCHCYA